MFHSLLHICEDVDGLTFLTLKVKLKIEYMPLGVREIDGVDFFKPDQHPFMTKVTG